MEAAAVKSFSGWRRGEHAHLTAKLMQSHSLHISCRIPTPSTSTSLNLCREQSSGSGWLSTETRRRRRSKRVWQSSLTDTSISSSSSSSSHISIHEVPAAAAAAAITTCTATSTTTMATTYNSTQNDPPAPAPFTRRPEHDEVGVQELTVYEVNEMDRNSPVLLFSSKLAVDWYNRWNTLGGLGDLVPFTNKLFDGSLKKRLGITAGIISVIRYYPKENGFLFESVYSFYFGDFGHISVKGPYKTHEVTVLTVTGGSGIFAGVYGTVEIRNVEYPIVLFYKFKLYGIPKLPQALRWQTVPPAVGVRPSHNANLPGIALPNFTD